MIYGIDLGHTLRGLGTGAAAIMSETSKNREIGKELFPLLRSMGHTVIDCTVDVSNNDLLDRVEIANRYNLDFFLSIHLNAGGGIGTETYIYSGSYPNKEANRTIAKRINDSVAQSCNFRNRGLKEANFYVIRNTKAPAALLEVCFVDSQEDTNKFNAKLIAKSIAEALTGTSISNPTNPNPPTSSNIVTGSKVKVIGSTYATGQTVPQWVKNSTYTVQQITGDKGLLQEISSWVYLRDLQLISGSNPTPTPPSFNAYTVRINTDVLNVRTGPSTSNSVAMQVKYNEVYTIVAEQSGWGKLKSGAGWISLEYTKRI